MHAVARPALRAALALALALAALPLLLTERAGAVDGESQAYRAGRLGADGTVSPSTPALYEGEPLMVSAVRINHDAGEPTIAVDREGVAYYAALDGTTDVRRSTDGGLTWSSVRPRLPVVGVESPPVTLDPYIYVDEETGRLFNIELTVACSYLSFSDDQGETWTTNPLACGSFVNDHQTLIAADPVAPMTTVGYPNVLYYCFNRVTDASCSRSLDGGLTWLQSGAPTFPGYEVGETYNKFGAPGLCGGLHGHAIADADGRVFIPKAHCGLPSLAVSEDGGLTWTRTVVNTELVTGIAHVGEHTSVTVDDAGNVYYLWYDDEARNMWMAVSVDHGATFGEPLMVSPPGVTQVNFPTMVAGDAGKVALLFPGTTGDPGDETRPWNSYVVVTENALDADPLFLSTTANDPADPIHRGTCHGRCGGMLDFLDIITSPVDGDLWAAVVDTCTSTACVADAAPNSANAADGIAVRQVGGPRIRTVQ